MQQNTPKISIIIPIYNGENFIAATIQSIREQPLYPICEIIIINDGSTDNTQQICESFAHKDDNIHLQNKKNQGVSAARNDGIRQARGQYIMFLDADDRYVDGFIDESLLQLLKQDYDVILFSSYTQNSDRNRYGISMQLQDAEIEGKRPFPFLGSFSSAMYKREILLKNDVLFDEGIRLSEDQVFELKALYAADKIRMCSRFCHIYVKNEQSVTHTLEVAMDCMKAYQAAYDWLWKHAKINRQQMLQFCQIKLNSRILLYAQQTAQKSISQKNLINEMKRIGVWDILMKLKQDEILPYQIEMLNLIQTNLKKFILKNRLEGLKIYWGRKALRISIIRRKRDQRVYPYEIDVSEMNRI